VYVALEMTCFESRLTDLTGVHIKVGGSGSATLPAGVSFPGAYKATDAGVLFDIYSGFSSYPGVGPKVWDGASSGGASPAAPTTTAKPATTSVAISKPVSSVAPAKTTFATVVKATPTPTAGSGSGATAQKWAQCGGAGFSGATACPSGSTCTKQNDYYYQCV
jgi:cellulase